MHPARRDTLSLIWNLANQLGRQQKIGTCGYSIVFRDENGVANKYELDIDDSVVKKEFFTVGDETKLRRQDGKLKIRAEEMKADISYLPPPDELAAVSRRDDLQHPFLNPLHKWAVGTRHYRFGDSRSQMTVAIKVDKAPRFPEVDGHVVGMFSRGVNRFGEKYASA